MWPVALRLQTVKWKPAAGHEGSSCLFILGQFWGKWGNRVAEKKNDTTWQIISRKQLPDQTILTVSCSLTQLLLNYVTPVSYKRAQGSNSLSLKGILHLSALLCDLRPSTYTLYHYNAHSDLWTWHLFLCFQNIRVGLRTGLHISRGARQYWLPHCCHWKGKTSHLSVICSDIWSRYTCYPLLTDWDIHGTWWTETRTISKNPCSRPLDQELSILGTTKCF